MSIVSDLGFTEKQNGMIEFDSSLMAFDSTNSKYFNVQDVSGLADYVKMYARFEQPKSQFYVIFKNVSSSPKQHLSISVISDV